MDCYHIGSTKIHEPETFHSVSVASLLDEATEAFEIVDKLLESFGLEIELAEDDNDMFYVRIIERRG